MFLNYGTIIINKYPLQLWCVMMDKNRTWSHFFPDAGHDIVLKIFWKNSIIQFTLNVANGFCQGEIPKVFYDSNAFSRSFIYLCLSIKRRPQQNQTHKDTQCKVTSGLLENYVSFGFYIDKTTRHKCIDKIKKWYKNRELTVISFCWQLMVCLALKHLSSLQTVWVVNHVEFIRQIWHTIKNEYTYYFPL